MILRWWRREGSGTRPLAEGFMLHSFTGNSCEGVVNHILLLGPLQFQRPQKCVNRKNEFALPLPSSLAQGDSHQGNLTLVSNEGQSLVKLGQQLKNPRNAGFNDFRSFLARMMS